jgi:hypothetical protein
MPSAVIVVALARRRSPKPAPFDVSALGGHLPQFVAWLIQLQTD